MSGEAMSKRGSVCLFVYFFNLHKREQKKNQNEKLLWENKKKSVGHNLAKLTILIYLLQSVRLMHLPPRI